MGKKYLVEEIEDKESNLGCGDIVAMIIVTLVFGIIALVYGLCGGFKSNEEDKKPKAVESWTEQPQRLNEVKDQSPSYVPKSSHPGVSAPTSTTASEPRKEASVESATEMVFDNNMETEEQVVSTTSTEQDNGIVTETDSETPVLTEKERRKAERQAKREARRREKAQKNN